MSLAQSIHQRLLNHARREQVRFNLVLTRYGNERFLYRLGCSPEADRLVLKGASLFLIWSGSDARPTRDVDLLGIGPPDHASIHGAIERICDVPCPEDALEFRPAEAKVSDIRAAMEYGGVRVALPARIGTMRLTVQIDIGFGDVITPGKEQARFPTLLDLPAPQLWTYPRETVVAEKLEAMVRLGENNTRMKDFWDLVELASSFPFDGATLSLAIEETFRRRGTSTGQVFERILTPGFFTSTDREQLWRGFHVRSGLAQELSFSEVGGALRRFLELAVTGEARDHAWPEGGPWGSRS